MPDMMDRPILLLVDDEPANLVALEGVLHRDDLQIISASSSTEALELLLRSEVSLAIIDVQMPDVDGFELARLMRSVERTRRIPIIFVTANAENCSWIFEGYEAGAADLLFKPIDLHVLRNKVDVFITLDKQRRALQRSEQRFRSLVEATSQIVWGASPRGLVVEDSATWRHFTGQCWDEFAGAGWLHAVHPEDRQATQSAWQQTILSKEAGEIEYRLRRPNGTYSWTIARCAPVFDDKNELVEWVVTNTDISARKETERLREMFIAILGHDLRNPVGAMMMAAGLVLDQSNDDKITRPLRRVLTSGNRILRMIEQLLDVTRLRLGGGIELAPTVTDLGKVAGEAVAEMAGAQSRVNIELRGDVVGTWDFDRMFQIVSNLTHNALQHSSRDTLVRIRIDGNDPAEVELCIHNYGPAIPPEFEVSLFEPFFQGPRGHGHSGNGGLGLGLFITKQLVVAHGGTIFFRSNDVEGTHFIVKLPRHLAASSSTAPHVR